MEIHSNRADRDKEMLHELARLASVHVENSNGLLELIEADPIKYPAQTAMHIDGDPQSYAVVESIAETADPRFPELLETIERYESYTQEISRVGELLKGGNNVIIATNHGNLIDVALAEAAIYSLLDKKDYDFRTGIVISKMVSMLAYKLGEDAAPCAEVLKLLCNDVFLSFPRSESMRKSKISRLLPDDVDRHNKAMRSAVRHNLDQGGMLLAIAPSGSKDKQSQEDPDSINLGTLRPGTISLIKHPKTYVLPVAVWLENNDPFIAICDIPRLVTSDEDAHNLMDKINLNLNSGVNGKKFNYLSPKDVGKTAVN